MGDTHDFRKSLEWSHAQSDSPVWESIYRQVFGAEFAAMVDHRQDGDHQRLGIDRTVVLHSGRTYAIDEKARSKDYGEDIFLEVWSDYERGVPGWACKALMCDYIAYAVMPAGRGYLLPHAQVLMAWAKHGKIWEKRYQLRDSNNTRWVTKGCAVPVPVLFKAVGDCLRATFDPVVS